MRVNHLLGSLSIAARGTLYQQPSATIDSGVVIGVSVTLPNSTVAVNQFLGIPFADSPPERFSPPELPDSWDQPLLTTAWKPACIQEFVYPEASRNFTEIVFNNPPPEESEDCLYLNVYAPSTPAPTGGRAVMYWIFGGSLEFGNAGSIYYNGSAFAAYEDVIVVTSNYRTNVFGFPNSPEIPDDEKNVGFLDQRAGLDWVQRNIAAFGGSPEKVTIFGESAGAFSIDALLTSYPNGSHPPFRAAILESGQISYRPEVWTPSTEEWHNLSMALNCTEGSELECVRAAPAATIKSIIEHQELIFDPIVDNKTVVAHPALAREAGLIANIPTLIGSNAQEGRVFVVGIDNITDFYEEYFGPFPQLWPLLDEAYPIGKDGLDTPYLQASQILTEVYFQCPAALFANASVEVGIPSWRYYYNASFPNAQPVPGFDLGVYHASELSLVFNTFPLNTSTTQEIELGSYMRHAWASFAKDPLGGPGWKEVAARSASTNASILDLGDLGADGSGGLVAIDPQVVDYRCGIFKPTIACNGG
ncbi:cholinesterase [Microthyrium microscopicum]|uniref:Carboxylic ester hydrolase n=1 Tax=Microthyrium microscopicum TaxID=703497 RepID=A0A6A6UIE1_9PEZI|nr:cholinesterase [Microthyrium microscopicum]